MKPIFVLALVLGLIAYSVAATGHKSALTTPGVFFNDDWECGLCIDYMVEAVNVYLNEWLQVTLPQDCQQMCSIVDPQHNSTCQFYCNVYGVYGFIQIISRVDIDPIYMCQLEKKCPIQACAQPTCATISSIKLSPAVPKSGDTVTVTGYYTVTGEAGAGMLRLMSSTPADGGWTKGPTDYLVSKYRPGNYKAVYTLNTVSMQPGLWTTTFHVCLGECDSKWPNSKLFDKKSITWTVPN